MSQYRIVQCPQYFTESHVCYMPGGHRSASSAALSSKHDKEAASTKIVEIAEKYVGQGGVLAQVQPEELVLRRLRPSMAVAGSGQPFYHQLMTNWPAIESVDDFSTNPMALSSYHFASRVAAPRLYSLGKYIYTRYHSNDPSFKYWTLYGIY